MFRFFAKNRGAISVFLTLILVPTFIFGGVLIDGSRILGAKNLISGAGDLAMNAALSNYHEGLNQTYGLLAMAESAEEVSSIMEDFFRTTLQAVDVSEEDFSKALVYLEFTHDDFHTSDIPGTEIFRTEVFRQEVLEYMKYRAPAMWVDRAIDEKASQLENLEKEKNAADGELTFESGLDDVQEIFDKIKERTDRLERIYPNIKDEKGFDNMLQSARDDYQRQITVLAIAYNGMQEISGKSLKYVNGYDPSGMDTGSLMERMASLACDVSTIDASNASNIIKMLIIENNMAGRDPFEILEGVSKDSDEYWDLVTLIEEYEEARSICSDGFSRTYEQMEEAIKSHYTAGNYQGMNDQRRLAEDGKEASEEIIELIGKLRRALEKSRGDYENWKAAVSELPDGESNSKAGYEENLKEHAGLFDEAEGYLGEFETLIQDNAVFYTEVLEKLDSVTFTGKRLDEEIDSYSRFAGDAAQYGPYADAGEIRSWARDFFDSYQGVESMNLSVDKEDTDVRDNEFVNKMKTYYCNTDSQNPSAAEAASEEWDEEYESVLEDLADLLISEKAPDVRVRDWGDLPSDWLKEREEDDSSKDIKMGGGLSNKERRKEVADGGSGSLNTDNEKISQMSSLAEQMGQKTARDIAPAAVEKIAEPLMLTEYVTGMFTCYTYDLDTEGNELEPEECQSLSGADMSGNILHHGEIEYILWGLSGLRNNVRATKAVIFAVNLIYNMAFSFTNIYLTKDALEIAASFPVGALGKTAIVCALKTMVATIETTKNMIDLMNGKAVPLVKLENKWDTWLMSRPGMQGSAPQSGTPGNTPQLETQAGSKESGTQAGSPQPGTGAGGSNPKAPKKNPLEYTYQDYLWIFVCCKMYIPGFQKSMLARTADCIELNMTNGKEDEENSLRDMFTMVDLEAAVSIDTFFMQRLSGAGYHVQEVDDETFKVKYYGVQGY